MAEVKAQEQRLSQAEERVKAYLEEQIQHDEALRALYAPSKIKECFQYITAEARKKASSDSYFADDAEVWKWARDYFIEELPKKAEKMPPEVAAKKDSAIPEQAESKVGDQKTEEAAETEPAAETMPEDNENAETDEYGFEVFGTEENAETALETKPTAEEVSEDNESAETPCEEAEASDSETEPLYDEDGNGLLFAIPTSSERSSAK